MWQSRRKKLVLWKFEQFQILREIGRSNSIHPQRRRYGSNVETVKDAFVFSLRKVTFNNLINCFLFA